MQRYTRVELDVMRCADPDCEDPACHVFNFAGRCHPGASVDVYQCAGGLRLPPGRYVALRCAVCARAIGAIEVDRHVEGWPALGELETRRGVASYDLQAGALAFWEGDGGVDDREPDALWSVSFGSVAVA